MNLRLRPSPGTTILTLALVFLAALAPKAAFAQVQTEMRLFSDSFVSPTFEATQKTNYQFVGAHLKTDPFNDELFKMDIAGGVAVGAPLLNYLNISEFYIQTETGDTETFYLGRKKMMWSELDARWDLGVWEPLFKWNPLNPERQGLTGLFWQVDKPYYTLMLFASPFYIPDQGPSFEIENGSFVKGNPWFRRPPESIRIWSEATQIDYEFERPKESQVVLQSSYGAKISFGDPQNFRAQVSYIYKPVNQLAIGYQGMLDLAELKGAVTLQPQVIYHSLAGADMSYKWKRFRVGMSGLWDRPSKEEVFDSQWTFPVYQDALMLSPFMEWSYGSWAVSLQHLDILGGEVSEKGELADPNRAPLMARYSFKQAQQLAIMHSYGFSRSSRLITKVSWTHSDKNAFDLIRLSSRYRLSNAWSFIGEAQLVKAGEVAAIDQSEIAQFQNNDRLMLGAAYVF